MPMVQKQIATTSPGKCAVSWVVENWVIDLFVRVTSNRGWRIFCVAGLGLLVTLQFCSAAQGQVFKSDSGDMTRFEKPVDSDNNFNLRMPTLGGKQIWTDHRWWFGWRIQQNLLTQHWRLVDDRNIRIAWGNRASCELALDKVIDQNPKPNPTKVVVLLHGLLRSSDSMNSLGRALNSAGYESIISFGYGSSRGSIADHATALRELVENIPGTPDVYFVGHSMGNIVVRHAIGDWQSNQEAEAVLGQVKRVVMLGPPNHGATIAKRLGKMGLFKIVTGQAGMELGPEWDRLEQKLGIPDCPFGIVAGDMDTWTKFNPLVDGASDMIVSVEEAKLEGATEMLIVPNLHSFLTDDPKVQAAVARFLDGGTLAQ